MRRALALLLLLAPALLAGQPPLTVERIFSEPPLDGALPREVHWLADGARFSFLASEGEGKQAPASLWIEDGTTGVRTKVVAEAELASADGGDKAVQPKLAGYQWSPAGDTLLLEGGGDLFLFTVATHAVRCLTTTPAEEELAEFSPDGRWVSFVRENDLFALELASGREVRISQGGDASHLNGKLDWVYGEELAGRKPTGYVWSPDSRCLAFIRLDESKVTRFPIVDPLALHPVPEQQQYPLPGDALPGVGLSIVPVRPDPDGELIRRDQRFDTANATYLPRFGWFPDGRALWYELLDRPQTHLELVREELAGGRTDTVLVETDAAWVNLHDDQRFLPDGRFIWWSERSVFGHLYLVDRSGASRALTSGSWGVTKLVTVDTERGAVLFVGAKEGALERQLYRVRLNGSGLERLTREQGTHSVDVAPGGRLILDTWSRAMEPPVMRVLDASGKPLRTVVPLQPAVIDPAFLGSLEFLTVKAADGTPLHASLMKPASFNPGRRYPVVVYVYGGPDAQVVTDAWGRRNALFHLYLLSKGFLVFSLDNRGSAARGREFERALLRRFGKVELDDQLAGVAYLRSLPYVDASRIGVWGWSYGGYLTCYALANAPGVFAAGAAVAPVTDWRMYDAIYTERYLKLPVDNEAGYRDSSPVHQVSKLAGARHQSSSTCSAAIPRHRLVEGASGSCFAIWMRPSATGVTSSRSGASSCLHSGFLPTRGP
jgi:dipeptidyl-peptidase-4